MHAILRKIRAYQLHHGYSVEVMAVKIGIPGSRCRRNLTGGCTPHDHNMKPYTDFYAANKEAIDGVSEGE